MLPFVALGRLAMIFAFTPVFLWGVNDSLYGRAIRIDGYVRFFKALFFLIGIVVVMLLVDYVRQQQISYRCTRRAYV